ncbi:hypothetical protein KCP73_14660 [Salmonella enterica subsp. enterica]|nr:hypothetical protein KCP73_14660 [Salmonella enterica subsp. enterica]
MASIGLRRSRTQRRFDGKSTLLVCLPFPGISAPRPAPDGNGQRSHCNPAGEINILFALP